MSKPDPIKDAIENNISVTLKKLVPAIGLNMLSITYVIVNSASIMQICGINFFNITISLLADIQYIGRTSPAAALFV